MRYTRLLKFAIFFSVFFTPSSILQAQSTAVPAHTPKQTVSAFFDAITNYNYSRLHQLTADDFVLVENGELWTTDSLITNIKPSERRDVTISYRLSDFDVDRDGDTAWLVYHNHGTFSKGDKSRSYHWTESAVLRRTESGWKIEILHSTKTDQHTKP